MPPIVTEASYLPSSAVLSSVHGLFKPIPEKKSLSNGNRKIFAGRGSNRQGTPRWLSDRFFGWKFPTPGMSRVAKQGLWVNQVDLFLCRSADERTVSITRIKQN